MMLMHVVRVKQEKELEREALMRTYFHSDDIDDMTGRPAAEVRQSEGKERRLLVETLRERQKRIQKAKETER
eukprot:m.130343 g.130343  ORF g.130343 m.130343 type:complete len:72 (+) comp38022_c0_seq4:1013-1228(+)